MLLSNAAIAVSNMAMLLCRIVIALSNGTMFLCAITIAVSNVTMQLSNTPIALCNVTVLLCAIALQRPRVNANENRYRSAIAIFEVLAGSTSTDRLTVDHALNLLQR